MVRNAYSELRPVHLRIDRMQLQPLDEGLPTRALQLRIDVNAMLPLPDPRHRRKRAEILQCVDVNIGRFSSLNNSQKPVAMSKRPISRSSTISEYSAT